MKKTLIKGIAILGLLIGGCAKTPVLSESTPMPEPEEIIPEVPVIPLTENKAGQLSFF